MSAYIYLNISLIYHIVASDNPWFSRVKLSSVIFHSDYIPRWKFFVVWFHVSQVQKKTFVIWLFCTEKTFVARLSGTSSVMKWKVGYVAVFSDKLCENLFLYFAFLILQYKITLLLQTFHMKIQVYLVCYLYTSYCRLSCTIIRPMKQL